MEVQTDNALRYLRMRQFAMDFPCTASVMSDGACNPWQTLTPPRPHSSPSTAVPSPNRVHAATTRDVPCCGDADFASETFIHGIGLGRHKQPLAFQNPALCIRVRFNAVSEVCAWLRLCVAPPAA